MISFEKAYNNIVKDNDWLNNYLQYAIIILVCNFSRAIYIFLKNTTLATEENFNFLISNVFFTSLGGILSFIGTLFFSGYISVYLRNLIFDNNSSLLDIKKSLGEIFSAGAKVYLWSFACVLALGLILGIGSGIILGIVHFIFKAGLSQIVSNYISYIIIFSIILVLTICVIYHACLLNFASKNLDISALFKINEIKKFFIKDYWKVIGLAAGVLIAAAIFTCLLYLIFFLVGFKTIGVVSMWLIGSLIIYPLSLFFGLMLINMFAQIYHSNIDRFTIETSNTTSAKNSIGNISITQDKIIDTNISTAKDIDINNSGEGENSAVPETVPKHFNWGAFLGEWIWCIAYKQYLWAVIDIVLWFVPLVSLVLAIILGINGNKWAWQAKHYKSVKEFHFIQKKWVVWALAIKILLVISVVAAISIPTLIVSSNNQKYMLGTQKALTELSQTVQYKAANGLQPDDFTSEALCDFFYNDIAGEKISSDTIKTPSNITYTFYGNGDCITDGCYIKVDVNGEFAPNKEWTELKHPNDIIIIPLKNTYNYVNIYQPEVFAGN